jgi:predicted nuclease of predicted toxin-antitoxin system
VIQIKIYIDEDAMDSDLVAALRSRGVTAIAALDAGLVEKSDDEQLAFAAEHGCVLYTFNVSDFYRLHTVSAGAGPEHAGMILAPQQRFSVGEQLRRILRLRAGTTAVRMRNQVEFLGNWG